ncbi:DNA repair protein RAD16 [Cryptococcus deuterogattii R265]|uniref:DNA repair protein RAD16 n=1 Tax=Cryptococcus deuterogattii (strain R265) TaxID=294750 RepID=UPI001938DD42|nr:DNA repair protein RAD16 [Cryptococcus deuterogattii R265]
MPALRTTRKSIQSQPEMAVSDSIDDMEVDGAAPVKARRQSVVEVSIATRRTRSSTSKTVSVTPNGVDPDETEDEDWANGDVKMENGDSDLELIEDQKPQIDGISGEGKGKGKEHAQPFNIGKYSRVAKASVANLKDDTRTSSRSSRAPRRSKSQASVKVEELDGDSTESEYVDDGGEYAMDSEDEARQLKRAIQASTSKAAIANGKRTNRAALNAAVTRVAGQRSGQSSTATGTTNATPLSDDDPVPSDSEFEEAEEEVSDLSDLSTSDSEVEVPLSRGKGSVRGGRRGAQGGKAAKAPSTKGKTAAKRKTKKFQGKGRKLGGSHSEEEKFGEAEALDGEDESLSELSDPNMSWLEKRQMQKRKEKRHAAREAAPRKKKERELAKKLGRKLTNGEKNLIALCMHRPELENVWGDLQANIEPVKPITMEAHPSLKLTLLPFQKESLYWMKKQEEGPWKGGMLADEMGMGKTIQTIALLLSEPRRKPSLVVAPVVALMQWKNEIETHAEGFTVCLWHGQGRMKAAELKKFDVVLVSYGTLEASFRRQQRGFKRGDKFIKEKSPMHEFEWYRVVLDEAHNIKERSTNAAKAAFALKATYKWCLSGTPLQNRVGELYSLVRFLGADPFSHYFCKKCPCKRLHWQFSDKRHCDECGHKPMDHVCFWNTEILTPIAKYGIEEGGPGHTAFKKLKVLLDRMMLRRTKLERADDLGLPPRTIVVRRDYFSPQEKELYMSLFTNAKRQFATYVGQGTVLNNYSNIFSLITRMRQMACHPDLVLRSKNSTLTDVQEGTVCRICNDTAEDAIMSQCKHVFDRECIKQYLEVKQMRGHKPECPVCHIEISIDLEAEALDLEENTKKARQGILSRLDLGSWRSSSKLEALVEELEKLRHKDCTIKSLVFSQFVSFLDLIAFRLQRAGFNICRLEGGMTPQQRDATIQHFMKNTGVTVFLISLKAGGVALNLTEASMVFMMDSWWNPSVEYQAMDRIHRLGQKRPVKVVKLVIEDSIEDQIVQLQAKKLAMTEAALSSDSDSALGKLTVEDLGFLFKL